MTQPSSAKPGAALFVWTVWTGMLAIALIHFARYAMDIPLAEDWTLVAPLTGHESDWAGWLWSQNNEHRLPLPRILMLGLLKVSGGDFRAGMLFNIALLAALALAMVAIARRLRGGVTRYTDAFFPIILLEIGDWQNMFWSWQLGFVLSVVLVCVALLAIVRRPGLETPASAAMAGGALLLAPLCGATGLLFVPPLLLWAGWRGLRLTHAGETLAEKRAGAILLCGVVLTVAITAIYFIGFQRPGWAPQNPGLGKSFTTAFRFQAYGLGPGVRTAWSFWSVVSGLLLAAATARIVLALRKNGQEHGTPTDRSGLRAFGLLACLASVAAMAGAMGWGRAAVLEAYGGWPDRYVLLSAPAFCVAYFAWELPGFRWANAVGRGALFVIAVLLLPVNMAFGREWGGDYRWGTTRLMSDIRAGIPRSLLAERNREFLIHWWDPPTLSQHIAMLQERRIGPLSGVLVAEDSGSVAGPLDTLTVRYQLPDAGEVGLIWGINDWGRVPLAIRPPGTTLRDNGVMTTPMRRAGDAFEATLRFPAGSALTYGFFISAGSDGTRFSGIWDGERRVAATETGGGRTVADTPAVTLVARPLRGRDTVLVKQTIRYGPLDARRVVLTWGVDQWQPLPPGLQPSGTVIVGNQMAVDMERDADGFFATVSVPAGRHFDFGFRVDRADRVNVTDNNFSRNYGYVATRDSLVRVGPALTLPQRGRLSTVLETGTPLLLALGAVAGTMMAIGGWLKRRRPE